MRTKTLIGLSILAVVVVAVATFWVLELLFPPPQAADLNPARFPTSWSFAKIVLGRAVANDQSKEQDTDVEKATIIYHIGVMSALKHLAANAPTIEIRRAAADLLTELSTKPKKMVVPAPLKDGKERLLSVHVGAQWPYAAALTRGACATEYGCEFFQPPYPDHSPVVFLPAVLDVLKTLDDGMDETRAFSAWCNFVLLTIAHARYHANFPFEYWNHPPRDVQTWEGIATGRMLIEIYRPLATTARENKDELLLPRQIRLLHQFDDQLRRYGDDYNGDGWRGFLLTGNQKYCW